jgi:hypothetical protein
MNSPTTRIEQNPATASNGVSSTCVVAAAVADFSGNAFSIFISRTPSEAPKS